MDKNPSDLCMFRMSCSCCCISLFHGVMLLSLKLRIYSHLFPCCHGGLEVSLENGVHISYRAETEFPFNMNATCKTSLREHH